MVDEKDGWHVKYIALERSIEEKKKTREKEEREVKKEHDKENIPTVVTLKKGILTKSAIGW